MRKRNTTANTNQAKQTETAVRIDRTNREKQKNSAKKMRKRKVLKTAGIAVGAVAGVFVLYQGAAFAAAQIYWANDDASISLNTEKYAQELENMLFLVHFGGYTKNDILVRAQYITAQYCKSVNPDEAEEIVTDNPIVRDFALKSMF